MKTCQKPKPPLFVRIVVRSLQSGLVNVIHVANGTPFWKRLLLKGKKRQFNGKGEFPATVAFRNRFGSAVPYCFGE